MSNVLRASGLSLHPKLWKYLEDLGNDDERPEFFGRSRSDIVSHLLLQDAKKNGARIKLTRARQGRPSTGQRA